MIKHIVLFKLKDPACAEKTREMLLSMKGVVSQIREIEVGIDYAHTERSFDIALSVIVDDEAALRGYAEHPYHIDPVTKYVRSMSEKSVIVDYRI